MDYTTTNFVTQTERKPVFVYGLPKGITAAKAAARLKELAIPLNCCDEEVERFLRYRGGALFQNQEL